MMSVLTFIFVRVFGGSGDPKSQPFPLFVLCGIVPFNFFVGALMTGANSIVESAGIIKRVPLPQEVVPIASVLSNCVHLSIQFALLLVLTVCFGLRPNWYWLWLPVIWILYVAFVCGLALGSSAINVYVRDTRYVLESFTTVLFWLVPIFYPASIIPQKYAAIYQVNPVAALVLAMRRILMEGVPPLMSTVENMTIAACVTLGLGFLIFSRLKSRFYEHL
jgi:ABC-type polysaccharide/polyol phosphate export permease